MKKYARITTSIGTAALVVPPQHIFVDYYNESIFIEDSSKKNYHSSKAETEL